MKTVNLIEAVNSGRRFRPIGFDFWYYIQDGDIMLKGELLELCSSIDFINSQFELEEKSITITESQLEEAVDRNLNDDLNWTTLKKELGF